MNPEKLKKLQNEVRIGGKGSQRRKKKVLHKTATTDDKKLQSTLKKLGVNSIPGIEEVNMIKDDGTVLHFNNPKVQASLGANTFAITGHAENKQLTEMLPGILNQLGAEGLTNLRKLAERLPQTRLETASEMDEGVDDDVPDLIENFDEPSKNESTSTSNTDAITEITEDDPTPPAPSETPVEPTPPAPTETPAETPIETTAETTPVATIETPAEVTAAPTEATSPIDTTAEVTPAAVPVAAAPVETIAEVTPAVVPVETTTEVTPAAQISTPAESADSA